MHSCYRHSPVLWATNLWWHFLSCSPRPSSWPPPPVWVRWSWKNPWFLHGGWDEWKENGTWQASWAGAQVGKIWETPWYLFLYEMSKVLETATSSYKTLQQISPALKKKGSRILVNWATNLYTFDVSMRIYQSLYLAVLFKPHWWHFSLSPKPF